MQKYLKYAGICSFVLAVVSFILLLATPAITYSNGSLSANIEGTTAIFGKTSTTSIAGWSISGKTNPSVTSMIAWILILVALVALVLGFVLPMVKKNMAKLGGLVTFCAAIMLVVAGILLFFVIPTFSAANNNADLSGFGIGAGWVIGAIVTIVAGAIACLPMVSGFIAKK